MEPLGYVCELWRKQIAHAKEIKRKQFGDTAERCWQYLTKDYKTLYLTPGPYRAFPEGETGPAHQIKLAKSREFVNLMLPYVHHKVPLRKVSPSRPEVPPELMALVSPPPMPLQMPGSGPGVLPGMPYPPSPLQILRQQDQLRAWLMEWWLNYLAGDQTNNLRLEARMALPEALVKGRGLVWHEMIPSSMGLIPFSGYESVDRLLIDPDCEQYRDAAWVVRERNRSRWRLAEEFGLDPERLESAASTHLDDALQQTAGMGRSEDPEDIRARKGDVVHYYEVYSRMGLGSKFHAADPVTKEAGDLFSSLGDNVYLVIADGVDFPLNMPPEAVAGISVPEEIQQRLSWPIPFWADHQNPWPFSPIDFYPNQDDPWATSPLQGALPLLAFLDHAYSYLMGRVKATCRDIHVVSGAIDRKLEEALHAAIDQTVVKVPGDVQTEVAKMLHTIQFPSVNRDLWDVLSAVERAFERATGMDPLLYGSGGGAPQMRSAQEASIRQGNMGMRPDDMAECVEQWQSAIGAKEALATRLFVGPQQVAPLFGETMQQGPMGPMLGPMSQAWATLISTNDPIEAAAELTYTVAAGTGRRKNKQKDQSDAQLLIQTLFQPLMGYAQATGNTNPLNALIHFMGQAYDMDVSAMMLPAMPPPQAMPPNPEEPPSGEPSANAA